MENKYLNLLKKKVAEGELNIFFIIAPPRSNSTLIEYILSLSTDIDVVCHEPFVGARKIDFDPEVGYKNIYDQLGGDHFLNSTSRKTILIKEMSQWLIESHEYKNLLSLTQNKILILIRNPLLTVESRIRRILKSLNLRPGLSLQQYLLDFFSKEDGIINFNEGLKTLNFGSVLQGAICEADKLGLRSDEMYISPRLEIHKFLLDSFAIKFNYASWDDIVEHKAYHEYDYNFFEKILKINLHRNFFEEREFLSLLKIVEYLDVSTKAYVVYDATDMRIKPDLFIKKICFQLNIAFSDKMIHWSGKIKIETNQNRKHEKIWYQRLYQSSEIKEPVEIPSRLSDFPSFMRKYILNVNLPIYAILSLKKSKVFDTKKLNLSKLIIDVQPENKKRLMDLGVVGKSTKFGKELVLMKDIDPIYAVTNDVSLMDDPDFISRKIAYKIELAQTKLNIKCDMDSVGFSLENEYIDLVDKNNVVVGITDAKIAHIKKQLHRVVGILLFDEVGNIILQSGTKYNLLELSVGGHVQRGENYEDAAHREMFEELGITTHLDHLFTFLPVNNKMGHFWSIFKGEIPPAWEFKQTEEVKNIIRVNFQEFLKKVKNEPDLFTVGVLNIINEYVRINNIQ
ncbi:hypothetical protein A3G48_02195 [Candidatus Nomurabacteria bacterium RIFCSPLOWO2_12_FULL_40_42]|uniref:Nudix hydrolase domain-containing protein n=1 Tax=Candidatus Nomurabacteria bacterium RIFCSPLOWO2_02_FULL_40_67 TaxID=1801787 RepID=A0A1F6Y7K4_9BACT|nr:MAG: hypothetical protein A2W56_00460 [Candidatus Nomurabacteria bacterium RIFCSPHIGHO2_02_41_18]OGJ02319.1 MAG: hypothetical protein A3I23_02890 [Candidatus Nomurabacteria bacterium RIFCSPLOWO2_02_FULL_40_67]OGJ04086.1 MAG: hypothetical protein A3G48_02195 [Candidatus Nomurabacteria bacterium RIFCSPLOWO2_12_FULL_40_42]